MAPSPEYDKEPKAPDKTTTNISCEDPRSQHNFNNDQQTHVDHKTQTTSANTETENNSHVETLDDGQLKALLDEAITYKCPKDREGKSSLFKELLEEVELDEEACEAAARSLGSGRGSRRGGRSRRPLPQSNSLQDLVAALAAEPTKRHNARHQAPAPAPSSVSTRAIHGGSLPSGVDTSSLLNEEPGRGAGYLATVRCVNPPPLAERRVSASDANAPQEMELLNRRSKPMFPMTYTARATLEIGSGSVGSGRAVTTTTASNQVRTSPSTLTREPDNRERIYELDTHRQVALGHRPSPRMPSPAATTTARRTLRNPHNGQSRLMPGLRPRYKHTSDRGQYCGGGGGEDHWAEGFEQISHGKDAPRGPNEANKYGTRQDALALRSYNPNAIKGKVDDDWNVYVTINNVEQWYNGLQSYSNPVNVLKVPCDNSSQGLLDNIKTKVLRQQNEKEGNFYRNSNSNNKYAAKCGSLKGDSGSNISTPKPKQNKIEPIDIIDTEHVEIPLSSMFNSKRSKPKFVSDDIKKGNFQKQHCDRIGSGLHVPNLSSTNPRNIKNMTLGDTQIICNDVDNDSKITENSNIDAEINDCVSVRLTECETNKMTIEDATDQIEIKDTSIDMSTKDSDTSIDMSIKDSDTTIDMSKKDSESNEVDQTSNNPFMNKVNSEITKKINYTVVTKDYIKRVQDAGNISGVEIELSDMPPRKDDATKSFLEYMVDQQKLFRAIHSNDMTESKISDYSVTEIDKNSCIKDVHSFESLSSVKDLETIEDENYDEQTQEDSDKEDCAEIINEIAVRKCRGCSGPLPDRARDNESTSNAIAQLDNNASDNVSSKRYILAELPNNAYIVLTLSRRLLSPFSENDTQPSIHIEEIESNNNDLHIVAEPRGRARTKKKKAKSLARSSSSSNKKKETALNKSALKAILFKNLLKSDNFDKQISTKLDMSPNRNNEVDSAIPFSCITTPEVVASCNTTASSQSVVAVDPKPLQLSSCYRAVTSLTGEREEHDDGPVVARPAAPVAEPTSGPLAIPSDQPRSVISSSFNGLPLSRPNYGSTASTAPDDYKKSLDENGNAVQAYSSSLAGSGQHKKPRRKKSSKNETVIDCRKIDGYQGDKDVNELLRFIESNAESARAPKLQRAKHRDDADDKAAKKRPTDRRKDKDKVKRASSLEELSRTTLEELTGPRAPPAPAKPERRSWGDARDAPADPPEPAAEMLTDFQTVTKKRKQRRRTDEPNPRRSRVPSPPTPPSPPVAPASDRSNDSNDDLDSVHSLPPALPPANSLVSYAEIARTRHNIPDLIESCNFYAEGEAEPEGESEPVRAPEPPPPVIADVEADAYPALESGPQTGPKRVREPAKRPVENVRRDRKERPPQTEVVAGDCPAPDVVADRRPAVILLDSRARPRDMDGVTFGFDINEQLLSGPGRRPRCDLLREALEGVVAAGAPVRADGCAPIRYLAPEAPTDTRHLHQIIDYIGNAWEEVLRCGNGKVVRYYSE